MTVDETVVDETGVDELGINRSPFVCDKAKTSSVMDFAAICEVSRFSLKMEVYTQKEASFNNSGDTSTFCPAD